ncbi:hypothetical protein A1O7_03116 [Cladophialophora yegresii CBS 114405]|uniref:Uncharacterized protein n=1 Tax=Cladophialophora yegresii CBS 114405 TaxID=1182544 RepID=W9W3Z4_9EURO|nr:uncharacterized protein A1O7_03116 [Cladophialophora yegresii CBS 114405]EXJ62678.1 hypothetical protein A1O7_03116 [Cladophialophora yegresii CBS 114405]
MTTTVAIWVGHNVQLRNTPGKKSVVTLFFDDPPAIRDLNDRLLGCYAFVHPPNETLDLHHFNRLQYCPANIFYDLDVLFNDLNNVVEQYRWLCVCQENSDQSMLSPLQQVGALYQGTKEIPIVKEEVEFHRIVRKKLMMFVDSRLQELSEDLKPRRGSGVTPSRTSDQTWQWTQEMRTNVRFRDRLEDLGDDLDRYTSRLDMLSGRLQSFVYLAIWGMTDFHTDPIYFLPIVIIVFIVSALYLFVYQCIINNVHRNFQSSIDLNRLGDNPYYDEAAEGREARKDTRARSHRPGRNGRESDAFTVRRNPQERTAQERPGHQGEGRCIVVERVTSQPRS